MAIEHPYMSVSRRLDAISTALDNGDPLPDHAGSAAMLGAVIVKQNAERIQRVKAAIGPSLSRAARMEAEAAEDTDSLRLAPPDDPTPAEIEAAVAAGPQGIHRAMATNRHEPPQASLTT